MDISLDELYKTHKRLAPFYDCPEKRAKYLELVIKHMMSLARTSTKPRTRIIVTGEEAIGWLEPHETSFAIDDVTFRQKA